MKFLSNVFLVTVALASSSSTCDAFVGTEVHQSSLNLSPPTTTTPTARTTSSRTSSSVVLNAKRGPNGEYVSFKSAYSGAYVWAYDIKPTRGKNGVSLSSSSPSSSQLNVKRGTNGEYLSFNGAYKGAYVWAYDIDNNPLEEMERRRREQQLLVEQQQRRREQGEMSGPQQQQQRSPNDKSNKSSVGSGILGTKENEATATSTNPDVEEEFEDYRDARKARYEKLLSQLPESKKNQSASATAASTTAQSTPESSSSAQEEKQVEEQEQQQYNPQEPIIVEAAAKIAAEGGSQKFQFEYDPSSPAFTQKTGGARQNEEKASSPVVQAAVEGKPKYEYDPSAPVFTQMDVPPPPAMPKQRVVPVKVPRRLHAPISAPPVSAEYRQSAFISTTSTMAGNLKSRRSTQNIRQVSVPTSYSSNTSTFRPPPRQQQQQQQQRVLHPHPQSQQLPRPQPPQSLPQQQPQQGVFVRPNSIPSAGGGGATVVGMMPRRSTQNIRHIGIPSRFRHPGPASVAAAGVAPPLPPPPPRTAAPPAAPAAYPEPVLNTSADVTTTTASVGGEADVASSSSVATTTATIPMPSIPTNPVDKKFYFSDEVMTVNRFS